MNNKAVLYGIIGFLGGILIAILVSSSAVNSNNVPMMKMMGMNTQNQMMEEAEEMMEHDTSMSMDEMTESLVGKTGDEFDMAFIESMIEHHEGAIDMANLAREYAGHIEIKDLADDIISAQTNEINMMREWQKAWGY